MNYFKIEIIFGSLRLTILKCGSHCECRWLYHQMGISVTGSTLLQSCPAGWYDELWGKVFWWAKNHRQFLAFLSEIDVQYGDMIYHSDVHWLTCGILLEWFYSLRSEIDCWPKCLALATWTRWAKASKEKMGSCRKCTQTWNNLLWNFDF